MKVIYCLTFVFLLSCNSTKKATNNNSVSVPNQTQVISASQDKEGCEKNNTGDYCFTNSTKYELKVDVNIFANQYSSSRYSQLLLKPGESKCVYNLFVSTRYNFHAFREESRGEGFMPAMITIDIGEINIEKCKTKTSSIK